MNAFQQTIATAARAATERRMISIDQALRKGDGCRAYTPDPPGGVRGIYFMHEWPEPSRLQRYLAAILGPFAKPRSCFCGEMTR